MDSFWLHFIQPILRAIQAKTIIEVGAEAGHNTKLLLEYCREENATLHSIDPLPQFDIAATQGQYPGRFIFH